MQHWVFLIFVNFQRGIEVALERCFFCVRWYEVWKSLSWVLLDQAHWSESYTLAQYLRWYHDNSGRGYLSMCLWWNPDFGQSQGSFIDPIPFLSEVIIYFYWPQYGFKTRDYDLFVIAALRQDPHFTHLIIELGAEKDNMDLLFGIITTQRTLLKSHPFLSTSQMLKKKKSFRLTLPLPSLQLWKASSSWTIEIGMPTDFKLITSEELSCNTSNSIWATGSRTKRTCWLSLQHRATVGIRIFIPGEA